MGANSVRTYIDITGLRIRAHHGVLDAERRIGNDFEVSARLYYDASRAMASDDVSTALNYADVVGDIKAQMAEPSALLEHAASRIRESLTIRFPAITGGRITITKLRPPVAGPPFAASFTIEW